ncbi:hypothetical protein Ancab_009793 [Ancistrocladus abbreviatus]
MDMKEKKLTVIGEVDLVAMVGKLRKLYATDLISVGPAREPETKKGEPNSKNDGPSKKKEETKKEPRKAEPKDQVAEAVKAYEAHHPPHHTRCYYERSMEEDPNACVIC